MLTEAQALQLTDELTTPADYEAHIAAWLLLSQTIWMRRRKLTVEVLDERWHKKRLSVDYELPPSVVAFARAQNLEQVRVPITMLHKAPEATMGFDYVNDVGESLPLPRLEDNLDFSSRVLARAAYLVVRSSGASWTMSEANALNQPSKLVDPIQALIAMASIVRTGNAATMPAALQSSQRFRWLAHRLCEKALVTHSHSVDKPAGGIVKLTFLDRNTRDELSSSATEKFDRVRAGWEPYRHRIVADAWPCGSFHLECTAPDQLEIAAASLTEFQLDPSKPWRPARDSVGLELLRPAPAPGGPINPRERAHLYSGDKPGTADWVEALVLYRVERRGFLSTACMLALLNFAFLVWLIVALESIQQRDDASTAVLLSGFAIAAGLATQAIQHRLAGHLLYVVRRAVVLSAVAVLASLAILLGLGLPAAQPFGVGPEVWERVLLAVPAVCAGWSAVICFLARRLPAASAPGRPVRLLQRLVRFPAHQLATRSVVELQ